MAAKTPDSVDPHVVGVGARADSGSVPDQELVGLVGLRHVVLPFITENIDDADTYTMGGEAQIVRCAWEATDTVQVEAARTSGQVVTFGTSASNANGYLHLWVTG